MQVLHPAVSTGLGKSALRGALQEVASSSEHVSYRRPDVTGRSGGLVTSWASACGMEATGTMEVRVDVLEVVSS